VYIFGIITVFEVIRIVLFGYVYQRQIDFISTAPPSDEQRNMARPTKSKKENRKNFSAPETFINPPSTPAFRGDLVWNF